MNTARIFKYGTWLLLGYGLFYVVVNILKYSVADYPINGYEPEIISEAYQLYQGKDIFFPLETGPYALMYAPLYQVLGSFIFHIFPPHFGLLRLPSILSLCALSYAAHTYLRQYIRPAFFSFAISFLAIFSWHNHSNYFDLQAKPDALAVTFLIFSFLFLIKKVRFHLFLSALLFSLAFATKQTMLFGLPPLLLYLLLERKKLTECGIFLISLVTTSIFIWGFFYIYTGDQVFYYVFVKLTSDPILINRIIEHSLWILSLILVFAVIIQLSLEVSKGIKNFGRENFIWVLFIVLAFAAGIITASKSGGARNAFHPFYMFTTLFFFKNLSQFSFKNRAVHTFILVLAIVANGHLILWNTLGDFRIKINSTQEYQAMVDFIYEQNPESVFAPSDNYISIKTNHPLMWSWRTETETRGKQLFEQGIDNPTSVFSISEESEIVVTVDWEGWYDEKRLEQHLTNKNFSYLKSFTVNYGRVYYIWQKN